MSHGPCDAALGPFACLMGRLTWPHCAKLPDPARDPPEHPHLAAPSRTARTMAGKRSNLAGIHDLMCFVANSCPAPRELGHSSCNRMLSRSLAGRLTGSTADWCLTRWLRLAPLLPRGRGLAVEARTGRPAQAARLSIK